MLVPKPLHAVLRLLLTFCLVVATTAHLASGAAAATFPGDPPPPVESFEEEQLLSIPAPPVTKALSPEEERLQADLEAFERARAQGPEAILALRDKLGSAALDLLLDEIREAQERVSEENRGSEGERRPQDDNEPERSRADLTVGSGCTYATVAAAIAAAQPGDRLLLEGEITFTENVLVDKNLTVEGGYAGCASGSEERTIIDGSSHSASTLDLVTGTLLLRNLEITGGSTIGGGLDVTDGQVTLDNTGVHDNHGSHGGGLWISESSIVTLTNTSKVYNNSATLSGGGARVWGTLISTETQSDFNNNSAPNGGGVAITGGTLILNAADMNGNRATAPEGRGGAIYATEGGVITMTANAWIYGSHTAYDGAAIYADASTLHIEDSRIGDARATRRGGGLYLTNGSRLDAQNLRVGSTSGAGGNEAALGAGMYVVTSTVEFNDGQIMNNVAGTAGAGIHATASTITLNNTSVGGTEANQANRLGPDGHLGVGLYLAGGTRATLNDTTVTNNTFQTADYAYGGGLYVRDGSVVTLTNSTVARHTAPSLSEGRGAGLYIDNSSVTLDNSQVLSNTAGVAGGGLRLYYTSTLYVLNNSVVRNNRVLNGGGGAINAAGTPTVHVIDSTLRDNQAETHGGAIYQSAGTLDFTGGWTLRSNEAGRYGGAIAIVGSADADLYAGAYSLIYNNSAGEKGGALYVANGDQVRLHGVDAPSLYVYANSAGDEGGAIYAGKGASLDVRGPVVFDRNWTTSGDGGAVYLDNDSTLLLQSHSTTQPELMDNRAYGGNGGAIYAAPGARIACAGAVLGRAGDGNRADNGGALYLSGGILTSTNCSLIDNRAVNHGGALAAYTSTVTIGTDYTSCAPSASVRCSEIYSNTADSDLDSFGDGGAFYASDSILDVNHTYLHRNSADHGGAIYQVGSGARAQVANTLIFSNTATGGFGAGIRTAGGTFTATHVTLANNVNGAGYSQASTNGHASNNIAWGNEKGGFWITSGSLDGTCNIDQSGNVGSSVDPLFVAPGAGEDYRLQEISPAVDACATGLSPDLDNIPRPYGDAYDMGAYEYHRTIYLPLVLQNH
ncbi:MAG: right-handed parallel beta-helix repeat-containing protein [Anaerolineales bacterium]